MTQNEVAEKMGLHYNTISAWVNSKAPRPVQLIQVLRVVGMDEDTLQEQRLLDWYREASES